MPPLFFDPEKAELLDITSDSLHTQSVPPGVLPLAQMLVAEEFPYSREDFGITNKRKWTDETVKNVGALIARDLSEQSPPANFTKTIAERLSVLGVFPSPSHFIHRKHFGGWTRFKEQIGFSHYHDKFQGDRNVSYDDMVLDDIASLLIKRYNDLLELPHGQKYEGPFTANIIEAMNSMDLAPSRNYFVKRYGGIRTLNEHLGFPDILSWDRHDYIQYGATILRHNGPGSITLANIKMLSANKYGPNWQAIQSRFDWDEYKNLSQNELDRQRNQEATKKETVLRHYYQQVHSPSKDISLDEMAQHRAIFLLNLRYLNGQAPRLKDRVNASIVRESINNLLCKVQGLTLADIETTAVAMDIFDDLWPMQHRQRLPIIANCKRK